MIEENLIQQFVYFYQRRQWFDHLFGEMTYLIDKGICKTYNLKVYLPDARFAFVSKRNRR